MKNPPRKLPRILRIIWIFLRKASFPGFDKIPIAEVISFFVKGLVNGALTTRASSVAYNFFLAFFPALLVLITLIPYFPIENLQETLMNTIREFLPNEVFLTIEDTVEDILSNRRTDILSFSFFGALIFATNGISALIRAFNASFHQIETRKWVNQQLIAILLVGIFCVLIAVSLVLIIFSGATLDLLEKKEILTNKSILILLNNGKWVIILLFLFLGISFLYYLAPSRRDKYRFISPGATLSTIMLVGTSLLVSAYLNNFNAYNTLYGSIGTIIVFLIWIDYNSLVLLIGFELNVSIKNARLRRGEHP